MPDNVLIPLPNFTLPDDFPWRVGFVSQVNDQLRRLRATGYFMPPRFFGYFFQAGQPVGVGGSWTVSLDLQPPISLLQAALDELTCGQFGIASPRREQPPDYLLVHDRRDGACWLWSFAEGMRFVEASEPVFDGNGLDNAEKPKLLGP